MRLTDAVYTKNLGSGEELREYEAPSLNLLRGSQNGLHIQLGQLEGNLIKDNFCNAQPYTTRNLIPFLMNAPKGMEYYPTRDYLIGSLKELVEAKPKKISGINLKLSVESSSTDFGTFLKFDEPTKTSYEQSSITKDYDEIKNKSIQRYWEFYIRSFISNPFSQLADSGLYIPNDVTSGIYTYDFRSFTTCYVEPDDFGHNVVDGCMAFNMWPKDAGDNELVMDKAGERETRSYSIPFSATVIKTNLVLKYAYDLLQSISLTSKLPDDLILPPANSVDPNIPIEGGFVPQEQNVTV